MIRYSFCSMLACSALLSLAAPCDAQIIFYRSSSRPTTVVPYLYRYPGYAYGGFGAAGFGYGYSYGYGFAPYSAVGPTVRYYSPAEIGIVHSGHAASMIRMRSDPYRAVGLGLAGSTTSEVAADGVTIPAIPECGVCSQPVLPIQYEPAAPVVVQTPVAQAPSVAPPRMRRERYTASIADDTRAVVEIRVPNPAAGVWVEDQYIEGFGRVRRYTSPPLARNGRYTYRVRVAWNDGGKIRSETREIVVQPGAVATVSFESEQQR